MLLEFAAVLTAGAFSATVIYLMSRKAYSEI